MGKNSTIPDKAGTREWATMLGSKGTKDESNLTRILRSEKDQGKALAFTKGTSSCLMLTYSEYITSEHWRELRGKALVKAGWMCESCLSDGELHGHHLKYRNYTDCTVDDIMCLCSWCHYRWHICFRSSKEQSRDFVKGFLIGLLAGSNIPEIRKDLNEAYSPVSDPSK